MKVIGYPPLLSEHSWTNSNLKLGDAVYAVIHHFQLNPPNVMEIMDVNLKKLQANLNGSSGGSGAATCRRTPNQSAPPLYQRLDDSVTNNPRLTHSTGDATIIKQSQNEILDEEVNTLIPPVPTSFSALESMTMSKVKELLNDESVFESFIQKEVATLNELKQSIICANVDAAQANLVHKEKIEQQSSELNALHDTLQSKLSKYGKLDHERQISTCPPDVSETLKQLNHAKKEAYRESETIADDWVESGGDIGDFVKEFMETRILYHTRAAKAERLCMSMR